MLRTSLKVVAGGGALGTTYIAVDKDRRSACGKAVNSMGRIANLISTVGVMSTDYAFTIADNDFNKARGRGADRIEGEIERRKAELTEFAADQERDTIVQLTTKDAAVREEMEARIQQTRHKIDITAAGIARLNAQEVDSKMGRCHARNATRLRDMCSQNKGVYIKLGQHLAMLDYVLPEQYTTTLSTLLAQTPTTPWEDVLAILQEDLCDSAAAATAAAAPTAVGGKAPKVEDLFDSIEQEPVASASLAQVHVAYKDGKKLAVKVQHRGLYEESVYDMWAVTRAVEFISSAFSDFEYGWLTREMNTNLPLELDFRQEVLNLKQATVNLQSFIQSGDLVIPKVHDSLSSKRVVTMDFEEGVQVNEVKKIRKMGLRTSDVAKLVSTTFCEQIYRHGFVHCDPHEGNILVRPHDRKTGRPTIVLLDHGLYKKLSNSFRLDYSKLWTAMILGDKEQIKTACTNMNVGPAYTLLSAILTMRPWDDIVNEDRSKVNSGITASDAEMLKVYAMKYMKDIVQLLGRVDSDMLLLLKTNDCLRHLDRRLGTPVNTTKIVAQITGDVLIKEELWPTPASAVNTEEVSEGKGRGFGGYEREHYSDLYKTAATALSETLSKSTTPVVDNRPDGLLFWVHPRTQRALWQYSMMQCSVAGLAVVDWYLWLIGGNDSLAFDAFDDVEKKEEGV